MTMVTERVVSSAEVEAEGLDFLIPGRDLKGWDDDAIGLVLEYQASGWTGRMSGNSHAIMHSPDGKKTASLAHKYKRSNRGRENARRPLNQWFAERERERKEREDAFGMHTHTHSGDPNDGEPPWRVAEHQSYEGRQRMRKILGSWWEAGKGAEAKWQLLENTEDDWVVLWVALVDHVVHVAGMGPDTPPLRAENLRSQAQELVDKIEGKHPMEPVGPLTVKKYPCEEPGCSSSFDTQGALNLHNQKHLYVDEPCPLCGRVVSTPAAFGRHIRSREHASDPRLPMILEKRGLAPLTLVSTDESQPRREGLMPPRACEYCTQVMAATSIGGHHRGHKKVGHIKIADGGDAATQLLKSTKAIAASDAPPEPATAVTEQSVKPEALVVQAVPATKLASVPAVNGTGHKDTPQDVLNQVRALINPDLVGELERLRTRNTTLEGQVETLTRERDDLQAWKDMMKEAMNT